MTLRRSPKNARSRSRRRRQSPRRGRRDAGRAADLDDRHGSLGIVDGHHPDGTALYWRRSIALQAHYVAETAIMTTLTWMDVLGQSGDWPEVWQHGPPALPSPKTWRSGTVSRVLEAGPWARRAAPP